MKSLLKSKLPSEWKVINLGMVCAFERGIEPGANAYNSEGIGERFLRVVDVTESRNNPVYVDISTRKKLQRNDIALTLDGTVGAIRKGLEGVYSTGIRKVFFKEQRHSNHLLYYILQSHSIQRLIELYSSGSTIKHASGAIPYLISIIPKQYNEQSKIAEILSTVDRVINRTDQLIEKYKSIKIGMMQNLFRYGLNEKGNIRNNNKEKFKSSLMGAIPEEWDVEQLGKACTKGGGSIQTGPFGSQLHAGDYQESGIPIITVEHLIGNKITHSNLPLVSFHDYQRLKKYTLKTGDLVFSRVGSIDRCSLVSELENGWLFSGRCLRVRAGSTFVPNFLYHLLNNSYSRNWILNNAVGSTMQCLNTKILSSLPSVIPSITEQSKIASLLDSIDRIIDTKEKHREKLVSTKMGLMEDLLCGKVRVNHLIGK